MLIARHTEYLCNLLQDPYTKQAIDEALSEYPMYVPENKNTYSIIPTREQLNKKLLDHYQHREIGQEVPGMFIEELRVAMNEIMPYYYSLFKSADIMNGIEDPFGNVDITESYEQETEGISRGTSSGTAENKTTSEAKSVNNSDMQNNSKNIDSNRPQTLLQLATEDIDSVTYADKAAWNENKSHSEGETTDNGETTSESTSSGEAENTTTGKTSHTLRRVGNQGVNTYAHDMKELREVFLNIEQQIINDKRIKELFFLVF